MTAKKKPVNEAKKKAAEARLTQLRKIRARKNLTLEPTRHLSETFIGVDGVERPFQLRYYQIQGLLHLFLMSRFVLGDGTGLGKTAQVIAESKKEADKAKRASRKM